MHIFIDESGTFSPDTRGRSSICAVGALVIPSLGMEGFERLYRRLRPKLPTEKGEVKGRRLSEAEVGEVVKLLRKVGALFEVVAIDMHEHSIEEIADHRRRQAEEIIANVTPQHHPNMVASLRAYKAQLEQTSLQLYVQSILLGDLIYETLNHANTYFAFRFPQELGSYHWLVDAKERDKTTNWEKWWSTMVMPLLESRSFQKPFMQAEGGDYAAHEKFRISSLGEFKSQFVRDPKKGQFFSLREIMKKDFQFSADAAPGLEAVDIVTNAVKRSMNGNFRREGWLLLPQIMIHRRTHYIGLVHLNRSYEGRSAAPYMKVLNDFRRGGRPLVPRIT